MLKLTLVLFIAFLAGIAVQLLPDNTEERTQVRYQAWERGPTSMERLERIERMLRTQREDK